MWITPQLLIVPKTYYLLFNKTLNKRLRMDQDLVTETLLYRSNPNNASVQRCAIEPRYTFGVYNVFCWTHLLI